MKHIVYPLFAALFIVTGCQNNQPTETTSTSDNSTTESSKTPTATFITETLELTHCESAVYDAKNNIIYASLIGNSEDGDGSIATVDTDGKLINVKFVDALNDPKGIAITEDRLYVSDITELVEADLVTGEIIKKCVA